MPEASEEPLATKLDRFMERMARSGATVPELRPALSERELDACAERWGRPLPDEVRALYRWRDGVPDTSRRGQSAGFYDGWDFLPLEEAMVEGERVKYVLRDIGDDVFHRRPAFFESWLFAFVASWGGQHLVLDCSGSRSAPTHVLFLQDLDDRREPYTASLGDLIDRWTSMYDRGAMQLVPLGANAFGSERVGDVPPGWARGSHIDII